MRGFIFIRLAAVFAVLLAGLIGVGLGLSIAVTGNIENEENYKPLNPALPTRIFDASGELITEFSSDERRELITLGEMPRHLILALLAREDPDFYNHRGFSLRAIARALVGVITGNSLGGGSTITQQVAGTLYCDRRERTIKRKVKELWWALQLERRYTKNEILEIYLNYMIMGPGTYGVEAASKYFFNHSARDLTLAEAAVLVVQLSSPTNNNPIHNPDEAMSRQRLVLDKMVELGYATREEADYSFKEYWDSFDYTRVGVSSYFSKEDKAPWFSEYVRRELGDLMYGEMDYYRDGYSVETTMDLRFQQLAEAEMGRGIAEANAKYQSSSGFGTARAERIYVPLANMLSLVFNLEDLYTGVEHQDEIKAVNKYSKQLNPTVDMLSLVFDIPEFKPISAKGYQWLKSVTEESVVEGALVVLENDTGHIKAIVGGSQYSETNQLIRATQAKVMPGSAFKPLYYSAAIDSREFTMSTLIYDSPMLFTTATGEPYIPNNYQGTWRGPVLLYEALGLSLNIPALKVLDGIGFDAAIDRAAILLGITNTEEKIRTFPRVYPMGLGIIAVSPLSMARAFAVFANQGRAVTPYAIKTVEDRDGKIIIDYAGEVQRDLESMGTGIQLISPQNAYMMTRLLSKVIEMGTLASGAGYGAKLNVRDDKGIVYRIPAGGKTGTSQNWSDAWAVGFTPYYTIAIWFGFDKGGNSLGMNVSGASLAGPIWGNLMQEYNQGLPRRDFPRPSGIVDVTVCRSSGLLRNAACPPGISLSFLAGTAPTDYCDQHGVALDLPGGLNTLRIPGGNAPSSYRMPTVPPELQAIMDRTFDSPETEPEIPAWDPLSD
ncbi:MAG: PBP1A family penicillin-binding protein [Spirochaetaceae bacterium]|jgi:penicillin-binding protein 1A|nr:PBP1A family penicillin-binding protein [Spirochaetaceae bacterium]